MDLPNALVELLQHHPEVEGGLRQLLSWGIRAGIGRLRQPAAQHALDARIDDRFDALLNERVGELAEALLEHTDALRHAAETSEDIARLEPGLVGYVARAVETCIETASEAKRRLLGDLIAKRFASCVESDDDVALRLAITIVSEATETQLVALANIWIKERCPAIPGAGVNDTETFMKDTYGNVIMHPLTDAIRASVLDHLEAIGAIRQGPRASGTFLTDSRRYPRDWYARRGQPGLAGDELAERAMPATMRRWAELLRYPTPEERAAGRFESILDATLTPAGSTLGAVIVSRLSRERNVEKQ